VAWVDWEDGEPFPTKGAGELSFSGGPHGSVPLRCLVFASSRSSRRLLPYGRRWLVIARLSRERSGPGDALRAVAVPSGFEVPIPCFPDDVETTGRHRGCRSLDIDDRDQLLACARPRAPLAPIGAVGAVRTESGFRTYRSPPASVPVRAREDVRDGRPAASLARARGCRGSIRAVPSPASSRHADCLPQRAGPSSSARICQHRNPTPGLSTSHARTDDALRGRPRESPDALRGRRGWFRGSGVAAVRATGIRGVLGLRAAVPRFCSLQMRRLLRTSSRGV